MNLTFNNVDVFCGEINMRLRRPQIDLSRLTFIEPFAVIYLGQFIRYHNRRGIYFEVNPMPRDPRVLKYLERIRFWDRFNFSREQIETAGLLQFTSPTSLNDIVELPRGEYVAEDTAMLVGRVLIRSGVRVDHGAVLETVAELVDNFVQHANVDLATLAVQHYPNLHRFTVAVGDSGLGIRKTLIQNPHFANLWNKAHEDVIEKAFQPLVSRREQSGTGLTNVMNSVVRLGGELRVASNSGFVYIGNSGMIKGKQAYNLPGVQIEVSFPER